MDHASLSTALNEWSERAYTQAQINQFIELAEAEIGLRLDGYQREVTTTLTTDADGNVALPAGFIAIRSIYYGTTPYRYAISGETLNVVDGESRTFDVTYLSGLPALTASNTTNWLIDIVPNAYFFMVQAMAKAHEEEWEAAAGLEAKANDLVDRFTIRNIASQYRRTGMTLPVSAQ